jgi:hypothetical protein
MNNELEQLGERIAEQAAHLDAAMHLLLANLREFDERGGWHAQGAASCAHWLAWRVGWDLVTARERVRVARKLAEFPAIDDALRRGEVSYSKVRALMRIATHENEVLLLDHARLMTASQLEKLSRKYALVLRHGQTPRPQDDEQRRYVRRRDTDDGMIKIEAVLHPEEAELVWRMLNHAAAQLAHEPNSATNRDFAEACTPQPGSGPPVRDVGLGIDDSEESPVPPSLVDAAIPTATTLPACSADTTHLALDSAESSIPPSPVATATAALPACAADTRLALDSAESPQPSPVATATATTALPACIADTTHVALDSAESPQPSPVATATAATALSACSSDAHSNIDSAEPPHAASIAAAASQRYGEVRQIDNSPQRGAPRVLRWGATWPSETMKAWPYEDPADSPELCAHDTGAVARRAETSNQSLLDRLLDESDVFHGTDAMPPKDPQKSLNESSTAGCPGALRRRADAARRTFNRADALVWLAQGYLRGDRPNRSPIEITLVIPDTSLRADGTDPAEVGEMGESYLSSETARRLSCDAGLVELVEDRHGRPLSVGRKHRTITGALKRALHRRDNCCTYPGCTNRIFLEGHHIKHWADGGETSLENTALLCSLHHRFVHEYGYAVELGPEQRPRFRDPQGRLVAAAPARPVVADLGWPQIRAMNEPLTIEATTIAGPWDGTPVDYGAIVGHLATADGQR